MRSAIWCPLSTTRICPWIPSVAERPRLMRPPPGYRSLLRSRRDDGRPGRTANRLLQLGCEVAHLVRQVRGVERGADGSRRDQEQQLGLLDLVLDRSEEVADDRDPAEPRNTGADAGAAILDQAAQHQRLVVQEDHGCLGLALREAR